MNDIGFAVFNGLINVLEAFLIVYFVTMYLGIRETRQQYYQLYFLIEWMLLFAEIQILNSITAFEGVWICMYPALILGYSIIILKGHILEKIFISIVPIVCVGLINSFVGGLRTALWNENIQELNFYRNYQYVIAVIITKVLLILVFVCILKVRQEVREFSENRLWILFVIIPSVSLLTVYFIHVTIKNGCKEERYIYYLLEAIMGIVIMNIVTFYFLKRISRETEMQKEIDLLEKNIFYQQENVKAILHEQENAARMRHDMKHVMLAIQSLAQQGNTEEIITYCGNYIGEIGSRILMVRSGIQALDNLLSYKLSQAQDKGIHIKSHIGKISKTEVSDLHLCMIVGNLIDNAIDALLINNSKNNVLEVVIEPNGGYVSIFVKNTIKQSVLAVNPILQTTKKEKNLHGFGIRNVKEIVERYGGVIQFYENEHMFIAHLEI